MTVNTSTLFSVYVRMRYLLYLHGDSIGME